MSGMETRVAGCPESSTDDALVVDDDLIIIDEVLEANLPDNTLRMLKDSGRTVLDVLAGTVTDLDPITGSPDSIAACTIAVIVAAGQHFTAGINHVALYVAGVQKAYGDQTAPDSCAAYGDGP